MDRPTQSISRIAETAGRLGWTSAQILEDRLELLALELREAKIRFIQALLLACVGATCSLLGVGLTIIGGLYALPPEWRLHGFVGAAGISILGGMLAFASLRRHLGKWPPAFDQSLTELKKDKACFSTRN